MFNPIAIVMNMFGVVFTIIVVGGSFYGGVYVGVKSQTNPITAPVVRAIVLRGEEKKEDAPNLFDFLLKEEGEK